MYRYRLYSQVVYGKFNEFLKAWQDLNAIARKRGWPEFKIWTPLVGTGNEVVIEEDFPDLASFEKVNHAFQSDAESMKVFRGTSEIVVQGSAHDEVVEEVKQLLA